MELETGDTAYEEAIGWHIRLRDGDDADWLAFEDWLARSPQHASAYDRVEAADLRVTPLLDQLEFREAANDTDDAAASMPGRSWRWPIAAGALAASVGAALFLAPLLFRDRYEVATAPGENQIVSLDGETRITLNGSTRMLFDRHDPRFAELNAGEALFRVRHDSDNPFRLKVGDHTIEDAGTVFNVVRDAGAIRVAVAEGKVIYNPGRDEIALNPGKELTDRGDGIAVQIGDIPEVSVGAWQKGQLSYRGEPLSQVVADISRSLGLKIVVVPALASQPFHGTLALDGSADDQLAHLRLALNMRVEPDGNGWVVKPLHERR